MTHTVQAQQPQAILRAAVVSATLRVPLQLGERPVIQVWPCCGGQSLVPLAHQARSGQDHLVGVSRDQQIHVATAVVPACVSHAARSPSRGWARRPALGKRREGGQ